MTGTFNQSLQCTQDVFVDFQAPSPPVSRVFGGSILTSRKFTLDGIRVYVLASNRSLYWEQTH